MSVTIAATRKFGVLAVSKPEPKPVKCVDCDIFYGIAQQSDKCSECFFGPQRRTAITHTLNSIEEIDRTGIVSKSTIQMECVACLETKQLVHKFACGCEYSMCESCAIDVKKCPLCRASCHVRLSSSDLHGFILALCTNSMKKWHLSTARKYIEQLRGRVSMLSFYADADDICSAFAQYNTIDANANHNSLAEKMKHTMFGLMLSYTAYEFRPSPRMVSLNTHTSCSFAAYNQLFDEYRIKHTYDSCLSDDLCERVSRGYRQNHLLRFKESMSIWRNINFSRQTCEVH